MSDELCKCIRTRNSFDVENFDNKCPACGKKVLTNEELEKLRGEV